MRFSLAGLWQLSALTDTSLPQNDLSFPAPLSQALPSELTETAIAEQEWHLMHDIEVDAALLSFAAIELVLAGIDYHAEVRLNGVALFDCDGSQNVYKKDLRPLLKMGRNRFEILFLHADDDYLIADNDLCLLGQTQVKITDPRMGIWQAPYLKLIRHLRLDYVNTEQIWHDGGSCEVLIKLFYTLFATGLVSAKVQFNGMTYQIPIDMRSQQASALFQIDAPKSHQALHEQLPEYYLLRVELDDQEFMAQVALDRQFCVSHFPVD